MSWWFEGMLAGFCLPRWPFVTLRDLGSTHRYREEAGREEIRTKS